MLNFPFIRKIQASNPPANKSPVEKTHSLAQTQPGRQVTIIGFGKINPAHRQHLQAYGLVPGRALRVLAQQPVTVIQIEYTELAFETEIARQVLVEEKA